MEKKVFVLTIIDVENVGYNPDKVFVFTHEESAQAKMRVLFSKAANIPLKDIENNYYADEIKDNMLTPTYAYVGFHWFADINECIVDGQDRDTLITQTSIDIINGIEGIDPNSHAFDDVVDKLLSEYSNEDIEAIHNDQHAFSELFVGQSLYQHALQNLGGKSDEVSTNLMKEYIDECMADDFERIYGIGDWITIMLMLCRGDEDKLRCVRKYIDDYAFTYHYKHQSLFPKEKLAELTKDNPLPSNHRELCSKLTDEQYYDMMFGIYKDMQFTPIYPETMNGQLQKLWDKCDDILYRVVWGYGTDEIMDKYPEIKLDSDNLLYADYDYYVYTLICDELLSKYQITPLE